MRLNICREAAVSVGRVLGVTATTALALTLAACGSADGGGDGGGGDAAGAVPAAEVLADLLVTPEDLEGDWLLDEAFAEWPDGQPGVIPQDQQGMMPTIDLCDAASEESRAAAEGLEWQVFTQLNMDIPEITRTAEGQVGNMVAVQEYMLAGEVSDIEATFAALRDGIDACIDVPTEMEEGTVTSERLDVGEIGDDRIATRTVLDDRSGGGVVLWTGNDAIVRIGTILWSVNVIELIAGADAEPVLDADEIQSIIDTAAEKIG